jgi:regulator of RNase E activity RraA
MPTGLYDYSTATLSDGMQKIELKNRVLDPAIRPFLPFTKMVGTAVTVKLAPAAGSGAGFSNFIARAYEFGESVPAPVMVIEHPVNLRGTPVVGSGNAHVMRDLYGFVGCIAEGAVRDSDELKKMNFPVYCRSIDCEFVWGLIKGVSVNEPIVVGGVEISPGDVMVGDNDGLIAIPPAHLTKVLDAANEVLEEERQLLKAIDADGYTVEVIKRFQPAAVKGED